MDQETPDGEGDPGLVWHYTDATGLLSMVRSHVLWATSSGFLNDRAEVNHGFARLEEELHRRAAAGEHLAGALRDRLAAAAEARTEPDVSRFFILSAARHWDLLAMWRCYGGRGESYAVGLDRHAPLAVLCDPGAPALDAGTSEVVLEQRAWMPVRYNAAGHQELAAAVFDGMEEELLELKALAAADEPLTRSVALRVLRSTIEDIEQALALIKHEGFADEREVRHASVLVTPDRLVDWVGVVRYRASAYGMAPYLWLTGSEGAERPPFTSAASRLPIRAVAVSPSPNGPGAAESLRTMLAAHGYDVEVRRSAIPYRG